uniref:Uncharacterized protein n=1 Tax=Amphiprion percula TaxID=161767 RepID=A0A3P8TGW3_AMPPE
VVPGPIVHLPHVQQQVQAAIQQFHCKEIHLDQGKDIFALLGFAVGEQDEAVGFSRAEIKRDGSHPLGVPLGEADVGLGGLKRNRVEGCHVLTLVEHLTLDLHLRVHDSSQTGQLQTDVVVLIHHL